jgi:hypothetical protein
MTTPQEQAMRDEFEAWAKSLGYQRDELDRCRIGVVGPAYYNPNTEMAWQAWQASAAISRPAVAQPVCSLGCTNECLATQHGCASECPALPNRPPFAQPAAVGAVPEWQPMEAAPSQKTVYLAYRNEYGRVRRALARHVQKHQEEANEDDQATEYDEATDTYYMTPGWYEDNSEAEINYGITGEFLGWMYPPKFEDASPQPKEPT